MPSIKPASAISAMRPSMITLVSSTLALFRVGPIAGEQRAQRRGIQQIALAGAHQQAHIGHQQQHKDLQHRRSRRAERGRAQHQAKQRRAKDAQHAAGHRADQPAQAERAHAQFKNNDRAGSQRAASRTSPTCQAEGMKEITNPGQQGNKKKTYKNEIHKSLLPLVGKNIHQSGHRWRVCPPARSIVKGRCGAGHTRRLRRDYLPASSNAIPAAAPLDCIGVRTRRPARR